MINPRGSAWRKWDLHVHTPDSLIQFYGGAEAWNKFIDALSKLPPEFKVLGINDYIFLDGYKKVLAAKAAGKLPNIDLLLPVIELRLDKFGGTLGGLSRVNYHIIFSNEIVPEIIESQFLSALCSKYVLTPQFAHLHSSGRWAAVPTRQSIEGLGQMIIESVPPKERAKYHSPIIEGFNNICLSLGAIQELLQSHYFAGRTLRAVGKTEWADIKWNDHSIADKKTIINCSDIVFISSETVDDWAKAKKVLFDAKVNDRLLDCSDAHRYADATHKDRLANCFTWIKADPTFEGLRQAVFEYPTRIHVSSNPPLEPPLQIKKVNLGFPTTTVLQRGERSDAFCFSGETEFPFSPYLTCIIGGRGTGKSTLLNLINEKLNPGSTEFFKQNLLLPKGTTITDRVIIEGVSEKGVVEFLQQNEIEQFASDSRRLTTAIFTRLRKLDAKGLFAEKENAVNDARVATEKQLENFRKLHELSVKLADSEGELATQRGIIESFQNTEYNRINNELGALSKDLQGLKNSKNRLNTLIKDLEILIANHTANPQNPNASLNAYEDQIKIIVETIQRCIIEFQVHPSLKTAAAHENNIRGKVKTLREELDSFLKARGLSEENLSDVGKATEKIAYLEEEITTLKTKAHNLQLEINQFIPQREKADQYAETIKDLLAPINEGLKSLSAEVKPIELQYSFDAKTCKEAMIQNVLDSIGLVEGRAPRPDFVESKLKDIDFLALNNFNETIEKIPEDTSVYGKILREYLSQGVNYEILKLQAELCLLNVGKVGEIHVLYDDKPVENSSFGQRCTAVIVVLLLLGNMPIVIDEPEAHLDSSLIAKYLVELIKNRKLHRQIIFATHNANFVINGDAELIHCMSMNDTKVTKVASTTIENLAHRKLLLALEGGEEAFQQRERRYGID